MTTTLDRPNNDQIEISVFGKGIGECSVIHLGDGKWVVIDSFLDDRGQPVALSYLRHIGVSEDDIALIVLTHWHDDHIRGASELVRSAKKSLVAYSAVLCHDEFRAAIQRAAPIDGTHFSSGVRELRDVAGLMKHRPSDRRWAISQRVLLKTDSMTVESLSPSDEDIDLFLNEVHRWPAANDVDAVLKKPDRNDTSVAILFENGNERFLFGADLEIRGKLSGWQAIHDLYWNNRGRCNFYKVSHHGSPNGHYNPKWSNMLQSEVMAVLTPYGRGSTPRPSNDDINRINACTPNAFSAGEWALLKARRQHNTVERTLTEASIELKRISEKLGHVRLRSNVSNPSWQYALIGEAHPLSN